MSGKHPASFDSFGSSAGASTNAQRRADPYVRPAAPAARPSRPQPVQTKRAQPPPVGQRVTLTAPPPGRPVQPPQQVTDLDFAVDPDEAEAIALSAWMDLEDIERLGQGGQGVVWKCRHAGDPDDGDVFVRKEMVFASGDEAEFRRSLEQSRRFSLLKHPHIIRYLAVIPCTQPLKINVIMPYYSEKDMSEFIAAQRGPIPQFTLCSIVLQLAQALDYLHSQYPPIVHRDLCLRNVLLFNNGAQVLLMDFDAARTVHDYNDDSMASPSRAACATTMEYSSPEALKYGTVHPKGDVFSLGIVALMAAALMDVPLLPLEGEMTVIAHDGWPPAALDEEVEIAIRNCNPETHPRLIAITQAMLCHDLGRRPTARDIARQVTELMEELLLSGASTLA